MAWHPFAHDRVGVMRSALLRPVRSLADFEMLGAALGREGSNAALESIASREPGFSRLFSERIAPSLVGAALVLLDANPALELHQPGIPAKTRLPRTTLPGFVAHMLLGTLAQPAGSPWVDGSRLFDAHRPQEVAKLRCMLAWFDRLADEPPRGIFSVERLVLAPRSATDWSRDASPLGPLTVDAAGLIEERDRHRQADFANAWLGGGVFSGGCVQEEIRFSVSPELLVGMVLSPRLGDDEAILLSGTEQFARTRGYAVSLSYGGAFRDPCARLPDGTPDTEVIAMDAIAFERDDLSQLQPPALMRELSKARVAFRRDARNLPIATGNWGCGAFNGDPPLKAILQWLAASAEGRAIHHCTFGDPRIDGLAAFVERASKKYGTVGALWDALALAADQGAEDLFARLLSA